MVSAQEKPESGFGVEANIMAGKIVKHSKKFTAPIPYLSTAVDVNMVWKTNGCRDWHARRKYPQIGVGFTYINYGDDQVFGSSVGIYPNLQIPLITGDKAELTMRIGDGIGYVTRKYQRTYPQDTINSAIGSHINDFAILMIDGRYRINNHWLVQGGLNFTHISNADTKQPNLGVNMVGGHIGAIYYPHTYSPKPLEREVPKLRNRWLLEAQMAISYKEARAAGSPILPSYIPSVQVSRRWRSKNKYYFGIDYAFHNDVLAFMRYYDVHNMPWEPGRQRRESWDGAVFAGNEFLVGRVGILGQVGVYYKQTFLKFDPICEKLGGKLYIVQREQGTVKEVFLSAMLLTHGAVAELAEFGIGASF
ncbi:MAG: secreted protein [Flavipsychrobacter sp.]|nr:secreted protein [Flavipsychrobacter sp.]